MMLIELLLLLLVILIVLFFLIFFKTWHIHIIFKNNNLDYSFNVHINFLFLNLLFYSLEETNCLDINIVLFSKTLKVFNIKFNHKESEEEYEENSEDTGNDNTLNKIKQLLPLLEKSKEDLYDVIKLLVDLISFDESYVIMNLGLQDNNMTIKFCSFLWALFAPLYSLNFKLYLTPEINKLMLKSNINLKFSVCLKNLLKIIILVLRRENLQNIIRFVL